jgi:hypothetical protein
MKKLFSTSLLAVVCCTVNPSFAQKDPASRNPKTGSGQFNISIPKFDIEEDLRLMSLLTSALHKDGLIDKTKPYKLEIKDGEFFINDKKQTEQVTDKYRMHFRADKKDSYTINSIGDRSESNYNEILNDKPKTTSHPDIEVPRFDQTKCQNDLKLMNLLIDGLDSDGLLDKRKPYKLEIKQGELHINETKQPAEVSNKYRRYFQSNNYALIKD